MFYQLSSYCKKHLLVDVQQNFLPETFVKFNGKADKSPENCCKFIYRRPDPIIYIYQAKLADIWNSKKFKNFELN